MKNFICKLVGVLLIAFGGMVIAKSSTAWVAILGSIPLFTIGQMIYDLAFKKEDY